jgi:hypothetical protein
MKPFHIHRFKAGSGLLVIGIKINRGLAAQAQNL